VATINGEQTRTTSVIKKTLNPYWNESFDMYVTGVLRVPPRCSDTG
jgi:E3 ubiquitin-protein ligase NEDD4